MPPHCQAHTIYVSLAIHVTAPCLYSCIRNHITHVHVTYDSIPSYCFVKWYFSFILNCCQWYIRIRAYLRLKCASSISLSIFICMAKSVCEIAITFNLLSMRKIFYWLRITVDISTFRSILTHFLIPYRREQGHMFLKMHIVNACGSPQPMAHKEYASEQVIDSIVQYERLLSLVAYRLRHHIRMLEIKHLVCRWGSSHGRRWRNQAK